jgi:hypothetical protein
MKRADSILILILGMYLVLLFFMSDVLGSCNSIGKETLYVHFRKTTDSMPSDTSSVRKNSGVKKLWSWHEAYYPLWGKNVQEVINRFKK